MRKITKILLTILGFILTVAVGFILFIALLTFFIGWAASGQEEEQIIEVIDKLIGVKGLKDTYLYYM